MSERWLVAMSGGVDSSVAAALVARRGDDAIGLTMDLGGAPDAHTPGRCCGIPDAEDARSVADTLGIRHYVANYRTEFREAVIEPFVAAYAAGETPVPCTACNRVLKFDLLLRRAEALGARGVVTGHYARIAPGPDGEPGLHRAVDRTKDQSYFLFDVPREALARVDFPLGALAKSEVREIARELRLATADKPESQGICFIPDGDVRAALRRLRPGIDPRPGPILDGEGRTLGQHDGAVGFTRGQRKGLGLSGGPWYVRDVDPVAGSLTVDRREALSVRCVRARGALWHEGRPPEGRVRAQLRHRQTGKPARLARAEGDTFELRFDEPVYAPAPGQALVVYDEADERLLGGGWIQVGGSGT